MKVLTIVDQLGLGGTEKVAQNYSLGYKNKGCDVKVSGLNGLGMRAAILQIEDIEVFDGSNNQANILRELKKWNPDIVHVHRPGHPHPQMMNAVRHLKTASSRVMETNVFARPDYTKDGNLVDVHLHLSKWSLWKWQQWTRFENQKPAVILPNAVNISKFSNLDHIEKASIPGIPPGAFILGRIGQPLLAKWNKIIFDVLEELIKTDEAYYLVLVGLPSELKRILSQYSAMLQDHIVVLPTTANEKELISLYKSFDLFLHAASIGESFGMVLAEAHLCELPIVTLSTPLKDNSQVEIVGHNRGGFVATDKEGMVRAVQKLKLDKSLCLKFGHEGRKFIQSNFGHEDLTNQALQIAAMALQSNSKNELRERLKAADLTTTVSTSEIVNLAEDTFGGLKFSERIAMELVHNPYLYKLFRKIRK